MPWCFSFTEFFFRDLLVSVAAKQMPLFLLVRESKVQSCRQAKIFNSLQGVTKVPTPATVFQNQLKSPRTDILLWNTNYGVYGVCPLGSKQRVITPLAARVHQTHYPTAAHSSACIKFSLLAFKKWFCFRDLVIHPQKMKKFLSLIIPSNVFFGGFIAPTLGILGFN